MLIVRIENENDGLGVFRSHVKNVDDLPTELCRNIYHRHSRFPTPNKDKKLGSIDSDEFCAFKSINQLKRWFTKKELVEINKIGFKILLLDVSNYAIGTNQILYKKKDIISIIDISELFI